MSTNEVELLRCGLDGIKEEVKLLKRGLDDVREDFKLLKDTMDIIHKAVLKMSSKVYVPKAQE
jgi:hypothetical protein